MRFKRFVALVLIFCLSAVLLPGVSIAGASDFMLWVSPTGEKTIDAICLLEVSKQNYYLFLPGNISLEEWKIGCNTASTIINGTVIASGVSPASILKTDEANSVNVLKGSKVIKKLNFTVMQGSDLPTMYITTESGSMRKIHKNKSNKEPGSMVLYDTDGSTVYNGGLKHIKMRGNASTRYRKHNYAIKLESGANLLGMGKAKKWILLGNHLDKSLIRNQMNFAMARYAGIPYTPDCQQVSVYVNNEYYGIFLLTEKIEVDDDRVDVRDLEKETEEMNDKDLSEYPLYGWDYARRGGYKAKKIPNEPEDVTGGYILEFEYDPHNYATVESAYVTKRNMFLIIHSPEYCSERQIKYISEFMQGYENAIFAKDGIDPDSGKHYSEFVDFDSLVNKYLINEVSKNYDSNMSSEYFFKPDDSASTKAYAGPVWDLDNTYGDYTLPGNKKMLTPRLMFVNHRGSLSYWWPALSRQEDFHAAVIQRYHDTFVPALEILLGRREETDVLKSIDTYAQAIEKSVDMEYVRYPGLKLPQGNAEVQTGRNLEENIAYLKDYITQRMEFLSEEWKQE